MSRAGFSFGKTSEGQNMGGQSSLPQTSPSFSFGAFASSFTDALNGIDKEPSAPRANNTPSFSFGTPATDSVNTSTEQKSEKNSMGNFSFGQSNSVLTAAFTFGKVPDSNEMQSKPSASETKLEDKELPNTKTMFTINTAPIDKKDATASTPSPFISPASSFTSSMNITTKKDTNVSALMSLPKPVSTHTSARLSGKESPTITTIQLDTLVSSIQSFDKKLLQNVEDAWAREKQKLIAVHDPWQTSNQSTIRPQKDFTLELRNSIKSLSTSLIQWITPLRHFSSLSGFSSQFSKTPNESVELTGKFKVLISSLGPVIELLEDLGYSLHELRIIDLLPHVKLPVVSMRSERNSVSSEMTKETWPNALATVRSYDELNICISQLKQYRSDLVTRLRQRKKATKTDYSFQSQPTQTIGLGESASIAFWKETDDPSGIATSTKNLFYAKKSLSVLQSLKDDLYLPSTSQLNLTFVEDSPTQKAAPFLQSLDRTSVSVDQNVTIESQPSGVAVPDATVKRVYREIYKSELRKLSQAKESPLSGALKESVSKEDTSQKMLRQTRTERAFVRVQTFVYTDEHIRVELDRTRTNASSVSIELQLPPAESTVPSTLPSRTELISSFIVPFPITKYEHRDLQFTSISLSNPSPDYSVHGSLAFMSTPLYSLAVYIPPLSALSAMTKSRGSNTIILPHVFLTAPDDQSPLGAVPSSVWYSHAPHILVTLSSHFVYTYDLQYFFYEAQSKFREASLNPLTHPTSLMAPSFTHVLPSRFSESLSNPVAITFAQTPVSASASFSFSDLCLFVLYSCGRVLPITPFFVTGVRYAGYVLNALLEELLSWGTLLSDDQIIHGARWFQDHFTESTNDHVLKGDTPLAQVPFDNDTQYLYRTNNGDSSMSSSENTAFVNAKPFVTYPNLVTNSDTEYFSDISVIHTQPSSSSTTGTQSADSILLCLLTSNGALVFLKTLDGIPVLPDIYSPHPVEQFLVAAGALELTVPSTMPNPKDHKTTSSSGSNANYSRLGSLRYISASLTERGNATPTFFWLVDYLDTTTGLVAHMFRSPSQPPDENEGQLGMDFAYSLLPIVPEGLGVYLQGAQLLHPTSDLVFDLCEVVRLEFVPTQCVLSPSCNELVSSMTIPLVQWVEAEAISYLQGLTKPNEQTKPMDSIAHLMRDTDALFPVPASCYTLYPNSIDTYSQLLAHIPFSLTQILERKTEQEQRILFNYLLDKQRSCLSYLSAPSACSPLFLIRLLTMLQEALFSYTAEAMQNMNDLLSEVTRELELPPSPDAITNFDRSLSPPNFFFKYLLLVKHYKEIQIRFDRFQTKRALFAAEDFLHLTSEHKLSLSEAFLPDQSLSHYRLKMQKYLYGMFLLQTLKTSAPSNEEQAHNDDRFERLADALLLARSIECFRRRLDSSFSTAPTAPSSGQTEAPFQSSSESLSLYKSFLQSPLKQEGLVPAHSQHVLSARHYGASSIDLRAGLTDTVLAMAMEIIERRLKPVVEPKKEYVPRGKVSLTHLYSAQSKERNVCISGEENLFGGAIGNKKKSGSFGLRNATTAG